MDPYEKLKEGTKEMILLRSSFAILQWDLLTYMPPRAFKQRTEQHTLIRSIMHRLATDKKRVSLVEELEANETALNPEQKREVYLARQGLNRLLTVPEDIVKAESKQRIAATRSWKRAKETNDWKLFESDLVALFDISRKRGEFMMKGMEASSPYDALMEAYEPGMTSSQVRNVFSDLRKQLVPLVKKYSDLCRDVRMDFASRKVPVAVQRKLATDLASHVGFDTTSENAAGRIDSVEHPFTTGYYDDVRLTVKYVEDEVFRVIFGSLHEAGHCLYVENRNPNWKWMALGDSSSSGISESQARLVENIIGCSPEFWKHYYPRFQKITNKAFDDITNEEFVRSINIPSKIRVTADEMTYSLHIILRFEIEQDLFNNKIEISEIPKVWREKFEDYLGISVENDSDGALQDTHWAWAMWGYFPNYCLGNLYNSMMLEKMNKDIPQWKDEMAGGDLTTTIGWLKENVHRMSNRYDPSELIERICGKPLTAKPFIKYLKDKYSSLYN
ncbi:MAG: carboxypeptidase M32 [Candidatus Thorarchaeota archaeon]|jgi:carboxypeptidase Taq